jgi:hypothetical protein
MFVLIGTEQSLRAVAVRRAPLLCRNLLCSRSGVQPFIIKKRSHSAWLQINRPKLPGLYPEWQGCQEGDAVSRQVVLEPAARGIRLPRSHNLGGSACMQSVVDLPCSHMDAAPGRWTVIVENKGGSLEYS